MPFLCGLPENRYSAIARWNARIHHTTITETAVPINQDDEVWMRVIVLQESLKIIAKTRFPRVRSCPDSAWNHGRTKRWCTD
jgi:hypothetical protein